MTAKEGFLKVFEAEDGYCLRVFIQYAALPEKEMLEIPFKNFEGRRKYYEQELDDNLVFKTDSASRIVGAEFVYMDEQRLMASEMEIKPNDTVEAYLTEEN